MASIVQKLKGFFGALGQRVSSAFCTLKSKVKGIFSKKAVTRRKKKAPVPAPVPAPAPAPVAPPAPVASAPAPPTQTAGRKPRAKNMRKMKFYKPKTRKR